MAFNFLTPQIKLGLAVAAMAGLVFLYFQAKHWYDSSIDAAREQGKQEIVIQQQEVITRTIVEEQRINEEEKKELRKEILEKQKEVNALKRKLQVDHELDALLQAKPGLVLKAIQKGTDQVLLDFEEVTAWEE